MIKKVFLSHNHADKPFVRKLAVDLENHGVKCWLDEAEMKIGDSLIQKIRQGIDEADFFAVILSPNSVRAPWVINELDVAMNFQIYEKVKVLPIMLKDCEIPGFLIGKLYADFKDENEYESSFKRLLNTIGVVFNKNLLNPQPDSNNLGKAIDKAISINLPLMHAPFHRPFQYIGMTISQLESILKVKSNDVGNLVVENDECRMFLEAEGNFVSYVEVDIKRTAPHFLNKEFDSEPLLGALSISLSELELERKQTHHHTYYDHRRKLKVSVSCTYDGSPLCVSFSSKYYGM
ncbi:TIR protein [Emticicia oligotrophica DSM 17448]|uniref:TIR protein n=1 Tax=Emticicia oligotrophica (strain DSM 17448 / CIP 109782 / MTCC 6937 / GPTSA100-15) TaxID=929562 RepID=A0ABM5N1T6_EMTOG|nr:toll/interleukin-1 receptor domain-containing protein [Emticicia oligotrophica]AFK03412.1 TIR protein [Emticicia oligotrophica DSM 17448]